MSTAARAVAAVLLLGALGRVAELHAALQMRNMTITPEFVCAGQTITIHFEALKTATGGNTCVWGVISTNDATWQDASDYYFADNSRAPTGSTAASAPGTPAWCWRYAGPGDPDIANVFWNKYTYITTIPITYPGTTATFILRGVDGNFVAPSQSTPYQAQLTYTTEISCTKKAIYNKASFWEQQASARLVIEQCAGTPTSTRTCTPTPTPSGTRTSTPTPSATPTGTPSYTLTDTRTPTPTPSITPSATPSLTLSFTPSYTQTLGPSATWTDTPSATPSKTSTSTPSASPSVTPSFTPSFTSTDTITPGPTPTWSFTSTVTPSRTPTSTPTHTSSVTPTLTISPIYTPTATPSFSFTSTATPSATETVTFSATATPSATPTPTPSWTATATFSATPTASFSATESMTYTMSPTYSVSPTVSPTPIPVPFKVSVVLYNAAGERVRLLFDGSTPLLPQAVDLSTGVIRSGLDNVDLDLGGTLVSWHGENDSGQTVKGGTYYFKVEYHDPFGSVTSFTKGVQVIEGKAGNHLDIYNSAGELVYRADFGGLTQTSVTGFSLAKDSFAAAYQADGTAQDRIEGTLFLSNGSSLPFSWDGRGLDGQPVAGGTYAMQLVAGTEQGTQVFSKTLTLIRGVDAGLSWDPILAPNPAPLGGSPGLGYALLIRYPAGELIQVVAWLYNQAGELVSLGEDVTGSGALRIGYEKASSGVYVVILQGRLQSGAPWRRVLKAAILR